MAGTTGITNLFLYNQYITDLNDDPTADICNQSTLRAIIDQTNDLIGQKCARNFGLATYKEWVETKGERYVVLNNYPLTNVKLFSANSVDLFTVEGTGFSVATVNSDDDGLTLNSIDNAATETNTELAYATYTNVTDLVAAINLVSGWTAEVLSDRGNSLTQLIRPLASEWALDEKVYMNGPYLGSKARVSYDSDAILDFGSAYFGDWDYCVGRWVFVWYSAGYTLPVCDAQGANLTTTGNVPSGLTLTANRVVKDYLEQRNEDTNMKSEKIGDYNYTRDGIMSAIDRHWSDLNQYARKSV